ncbi:MAG: hypothetical protein KDB65_12645 [Calditrichaeota bacterium]|nr:hypothetical protein [Calditrichota bacterium]MCB9368181.1 hypothetical protein [Calditrichota bacterium]
MRSLVSWVVLAAMLCAIPTMAQFRSQPTSGQTSEYLRDHQQNIGLSSVRGLLDPSRMHMSHQVSFGYANGGGTSVSRGLYLNRIDYQLLKPLFLTTHLGYQFQPSGPAEWNPANTGNDFVGGADLTWVPSNNSIFRLSVYKGMSPYRSWGSPFYGGYDYSPWAFPGRP